MDNFDPFSFHDWLAREQKELAELRVKQEELKFREKQVLENIATTKKLIKQMEEAQKDSMP